MAPPRVHPLKSVPRLLRGGAAGSLSRAVTKALPGGLRLFCLSPVPRGSVFGAGAGEPSGVASVGGGLPHLEEQK